MGTKGVKVLGTRAYAHTRVRIRRYTAYYFVLNSVELLAYAVLVFAAWPKKSERKVVLKNKLKKCAPSA